MMEHRGKRIRFSLGLSLLACLVAITAMADICFVSCPYCGGQQTAEVGWTSSVDVNGDGGVSIEDLGVFACFYYVQPANPACDFNCDESVSIIDLYIFTMHYQGACLWDNH